MSLISMESQFREEVSLRDKVSLILKNGRELTGYVKQYGEDNTVLLEINNSARPVAFAVIGYYEVIESSGNNGASLDSFKKEFEESVAFFNNISLKYIFSVDNLKNEFSRAKAELPSSFNSVMDSLLNAIKINETDPRFGRMGKVIGSALAIAKENSSLFIQSFLGDTYSIAGEYAKAAESYMKAKKYLQAAVIYQKLDDRENLFLASALACLKGDENVSEINPELFKQMVVLSAEIKDLSLLKQWYEKGKDSEDEMFIAYLINAYCYLLTSVQKEAKLTGDRFYSQENLQDLNQQILAEFPLNPTENILNKALEYSQSVYSVANIELNYESKNGGQNPKESEAEPHQNKSNSQIHSEKNNPHTNVGYISNYIDQRGFGYIETQNGDIFFHIYQVTDPEIRDCLTTRNWLRAAVQFDIGQNDRGPCAVNVRKADTTLDPRASAEIRFGYVYSYNSQGFGEIWSNKERLKFSLEEVTDYRLRERLIRNKDTFGINVEFETQETAPDQVEAVKIRLRKVYPPAQSTSHKPIQKVSSHSHASIYDYARKNINVRPDEEVIELFFEAIKANDRVESSVLDIVSLYVKKGETDKAEALIRQYERMLPEEKKINSLITIYDKAKKYDLLLLELDRIINITDKTSTKLHYTNRKAKVLKTLKKWNEAIISFKQWEKIEQENKTLLGIKGSSNPFALIELNVKREIAICYWQLSQKEEALKYAEEIKKRNDADFVANAMLEGTYNDESSEESVEPEETLNHASLGDLEFEFELNDIMLYRLHSFNLATCISARRLEGDKYNAGIKEAKEDIKNLRETTTQQPKNSMESSRGAAKIIQQFLETKNYPNDEVISVKNRNNFLIRSLMSEGDFSLQQDVSIDVARYFYLEVTKLIKGRKDQVYDNSVVRYVASFFVERYEIPISMKGHQNIHIDKNLPIYFKSEEYIDRIPQFIPACALLSLSSEELQEKLMDMIHNYESVKNAFVKGLAVRMGRAHTVYEMTTKEGFKAIWVSYMDYYKRQQAEIRRIMQEMKSFKFNMLWLDKMIEDVEGITNYKILYGKDLERLRSISEILSYAKKFVSDNDFEIRDSMLRQIIERSESLEKEIIEKPTTYAFDYFRQIMPSFYNLAKENLEELYTRFKPELSIELITNNIFLAANERSARLQFIVTNKQFTQTIQNIEYTSKAFKTKLESENKGYIKGGNSETIILIVELTPQYIANKAFSFDLNLSFEYKDTPQSLKREALTKEFSITLSDEKEFVEIANPYQVLDSGSEVKNKDMFFGRDAFIDTIADMLISKDGELLRSHTISLYGQKRAGKSSILYHLRNTIEERSPKSLLIDLGNIENLFGDIQKDEFVSNLRYSILDSLNDQISERFPELESMLEEKGIRVPVDEMLTANNAAIFKSFIEKFNKLIGKDYNVILFIDEFTYIYQRIKRGDLHESFMQLWKAMIQDFEFVGIVVGQDYMETFIKEFSNPFGTCKNNRVTYLSREDAKQLIRKPIEIPSLNPQEKNEDRYKSEEAVERILQLTAGSAYYIVKICSQLVSYLNKKHSPYIVEADVNYIVKNVLLQGNNMMGIDVFDPLYKDEGDFQDLKKPEDNLKILKVIAQKAKEDGFCSLDDLHCEELSKERISYLIDVLHERDVLEMKNNSVKIKVGLFKEWLLNKYGR